MYFLFWIKLFDFDVGGLATSSKNVTKYWQKEWLSKIEWEERWSEASVDLWDQYLPGESQISSYMPEINEEIDNSEQVKVLFFTDFKMLFNSKDQIKI